MTLHEWLGIENSTNDITKLYNQIQLVAYNIQKNNKKSRILNFILIIICVISLGLSLFMVTRIQYYEKLYQGYIDSHQCRGYFTDVNVINNENQLFIEVNDITYMEVSKYDLENKKITLNYQLTL